MEPIPPLFEAVTAGFEMTVLHDQDGYRTLRGQKPRGGEYWFEISTQPGVLTVRGDCEAFTFVRGREDMFAFFRHGIWADGSLHINPGHWATKLASGREGAQEYSQDVFDDYVTETLAESEQEFPGLTEAWTVHAEPYNTESEHDAREALATFEYGAKLRITCTCGESVEADAATSIASSFPAFRSAHTGPGHTVTSAEIDGFEFPDPVDLDLAGFAWWFQFACSAIVWAIARYDAYTRGRRAGRARHKVTFSHGGLHRDIQHPVECDWLGYGEMCDFEQAIELQEIDTAPPVVAGTVWATAVVVHQHPLDEPCPGCAPQVRYEPVTESASATRVPAVA